MSNNGRFDNQINLDQRILDRLNHHDPGQPFENVLNVKTDSGSVYHIKPDGTMTCLEGTRAGKEVGIALGSVYRPFGPMRVGVAVVGLSIEAKREEDATRKTFVTSPVVDIINVEE